MRLEVSISGNIRKVPFWADFFNFFEVEIKKWPRLMHIIYSKKERFAKIFNEFYTKLYTKHSILDRVLNTALS